MDLLERSVGELFREAAEYAPPDGVLRMYHGGGVAVVSPAARAHEAANAAAELLASAFALLVREAVPLLERLGTSTLARALREERPGVAVAGLLADIALESLVDDAEDDPLAKAVAASAKRRRELLREAGGGLTTAAVAKALGTSRQAVDKRRKAGTLLAVPLPSGEWAFPAAQFAPDGRPLEGFADALRAFQIDDPWMRLAELLTEDADLGGRSAFEVLQEEGRGGLPAVRRALASTGEQGA